jgi:hypothetical protein
MAAMSQIPPLPPEPVVLNYASGTTSSPRVIAMLQKYIIYCVLANILLMAAAVNMDVKSAGSLGVLVVFRLAALAVVVAGAVFVFRLAIRIYGTGWGVVLGILALIPLVGLIVLLIVNGKATRILRKNGIGVGLLGARLRDLPAQ